jgi:phosphate transport system permease protein
MSTIAGKIKIISPVRLNYTIIAAVFTLLISSSALVLGFLSLAMNSWEKYPVPLLLVLAFALFILYFSSRFSHTDSKWGIAGLAAIAFISAIILRILPEYLQGLNLNAIIHRSLISALLLLSIGLPGMCYALYYLLGAKPRAFDISRYPLFLFPILLILSAYILIIFHIIADGWSGLNWSLLTTPFKYQSWDSMVWQDGWPVMVPHTVEQIGMRNHILGTFLLMGLTAVISLPVGMGTGIFVYQNSGTKLAGIVNFSTTALRAISGIILAITALNLTGFAATSLNGTMLGNIINGFGYYGNGELITGRSSFLVSSIFISLLVIPIISRATQEGLTSVPKDIYEGSLAVGASSEHTLTHLMLPWSFPNIITGLVIGCAEAAGSLTIIFLIAGTGEFGVSPFNETTSLGYLIFDCKYGTTMGDSIERLMGDYKFTAALLLLIITIGLTVAALVLKNKFSRRYKGA